MSREAAFAATKNVLIKEAELKAKNKAEYRLLCEKIDALLLSWQEANVEPPSLVAKTCARMSEVLQERYEGFHPAVVPLGSFGRGTWRVREVFGSIDNADLDWTMLIDFPDSFDFTKEVDLYEFYKNQIGFNRRLMDTLFTLVSEQSQGKLRSCKTYMPGILGWGFNLTTLEQARYLVPRLRELELKTKTDIKCTWFLSSFPAEANQKSREYFFKAVSELPADQQKTMFDYVVTGLTQFLTPQSHHIHEKYLQEIEKVKDPKAFLANHREQLLLLENLAVLTNGLMSDAIIKMLTKMRSEAGV